MSQRVSHSVLDPWFAPAVPRLYEWFSIPKRFPPEGIILCGHLLAIAGAVGFAFSTHYWWGGLLLFLGVAGNHLADMLDGTHARRSGQCRNGGELLDHFTDPLSFSYWMIGWGVACDHLWLTVGAVICIYATAVLTNIKAKISGEFTLASFGPTEFKALLAVFGLVLAAAHGFATTIQLTDLLTAAFAVLLAVGVVQLVYNLYRSVKDVNRQGPKPDTSEWNVVRK